MFEGDKDVEDWLAHSTFSVGDDGFLCIGTTSDGVNSSGIKIRWNGYLLGERVDYVCISYRVVGLDDYSALNGKKILIGDGRDWGHNRCDIPVDNTTAGWNFAYFQYTAKKHTFFQDNYMRIQFPDMNDTNVSFEIDFVGFASSEDKINAMKTEHDAFVTKIASSDFVAAPVVSLASGAYGAEQTLTVTAKTGVDVYYTTNGSEPSATNGTKYTAPVTVPVDNDKVQIYKFVAVKGGNASKVITRTYNVANLCKTPTILPLGNYYPEGMKITIQNNEEGAAIYYTTDGSEPTTSSTKYSAPFDLTLDAEGKGTVKAIAVKSGKGDSAVATRTIAKKGADYYYWVFPGIKPLSSGYEADGWRLIDGYQLQNDTDGSVKLVFNSEKHNQLLSWLDCYVTNGQHPNSSYPYIKICYKSTVDVDLGFSFDWFNNMSLDKDDQGNAVGANHPYHQAHADLSASSIYTTAIINVADLCKIWDKFVDGVKHTGILIDAKGEVSATDQFNLMYVAFFATKEAAEAFDMVSIPSFSQAGGFYTETVDVSLSTTTEGAEIYYTTDGTTPSKTNGMKYTGAFKLSETTTVKAIAVKEGLTDSAVVTVEYEISLKVKQPEVSVPSGKYTTEQEITITTKTDGAKIYYTTDGSDPTAENGTLYTGAFKLSKSCILRVVAVCEGMENSTVTAVNYKFELASTEESTTAAPSDSASTDDTNKTDDKGCASVIGLGTALPIVLAMGAAVLLGKKKED